MAWQITQYLSQLVGGWGPAFPSPVIALTGCLHQSGRPCSLYQSLSSAHVTLPETGHQGISLSAEGTSFCEKMVIVPNMAPVAAGRTTQGPSSQPIGCGLSLCCGLLGSCVKLRGGRKYLLGHLSRVSSFDSDHGHSIRAGCPLLHLCLTRMPTASFQGIYVCVRVTSTTFLASELKVPPAS